MKRTLFFLLSVILFAACTKDVDENLAPNVEELAAYSKIVGHASTDAVRGMAVIRVSEEVADRIEAGVTRSGGTRSGIESIDNRLDEIGVENFLRVFPVDERFEADHRAAGLHLWYYVTFDEKNDLMAAARTLSLDDNILSVSFDRKLKRMGQPEMIPLSEVATRAAQMPYNDPLLEYQWHYNNDGTVPAKAVAGADVNAFNAWKVFDADASAPEIVVAVIDEPVQATHPDLAANMWVNPNAEEVEKGLKHGANFVVIPKGDANWYVPTNTADEYILPLTWELTQVYNANGSMAGYTYMDHGTHVAGTIAAVNNNGVGVAGVAGGNSGEGGCVKIMACQIYRPISASYEAESSDVCTARALVWAADRGAVVANNSWGYEGSTMTEEQFKQLIICAGIDYFIDHNKSNVLGGKGLLIFSAGNSGDVNRGKECWPAAYSRVISVSAFGPDFTPAYYSDYGKWTTLSTPGGDPYSSESTGSDAPYNSLGRYGNGCVLSTIIDPATADTKIETDRTDSYAWMCGTSMSSPHATGVAALGLAYAQKLGVSYTLEEYKSLLVASTNSLAPYLKSPYVATDMGAGALDALQLLCNIGGYPILTVPADGEMHRVEVGKLLGGAGSRTCAVDAADAKTRLGITTNISLAPAGGWTVACTKAGAALISISTQDPVGGVPVSRKVLLVAKGSTTSNGAWL